MPPAQLTTRRTQARHVSRVAVATLAATTLLGGVALAAGNLATAGPKADGTGITPTGYHLTPAGAQTALGDLPMNSALSPDEHTLLVVNAGQGRQSLQVIDTASGTTVQTIRYDAPEALYQGVAFSPDGRRAYASAGGNNKVRVYDVTGQHLAETAPIALPTTAPDGSKFNPYAAGLAISKDGRTGYVVDQLADAMTVLDLAAGKVTATVGVGHNPQVVALGRDGRTAYVANQGADTVSVVNVSNPMYPTVAKTVTVGTHPDALLLRGKDLYVANGDADTVSVLDTERGRVARTLVLAPYHGAPVGSNPEGLALSRDGRTLYVAEAGADAIDVVDLQPAKGHVRGEIPTGWYPSSLQLAGDTLLVTNAKGLGAGPNDGPGFPNPTSSAPRSPSQYSGSMIVGSLSSIAVPSEKALRRYTRRVQDNDGYGRKGQVARTGGRGNPVPHRVGQASPIKHVIYVVRENRTFDQVLGSNGRGNANPKLNLFGDDSAPNVRTLAKKFTTFDNFYADAEVSADGWNWIVAANANRYVQGTWVANYSGRNHPYDYEGGNLASAPNVKPTDAYIWDRLSDKAIPYRNYGFYTFQDSTGSNVTDTTDPVLPANTDHSYVGFDMNCPDHANSFTPQSRTCGLPRMEEWNKEFSGYEQNNDLPAMTFMRLPSDHTSGTRVGKPTPQAYVADNDWALGQLVDRVSHSKYWDSTAIFVTEDDAQNGPDHVDAHRTVATVISPYTQTGKVDSTLYSTASMLRTMELINGIGPMSQFDAFATPMSAAFTERRNATPYTAVKPSYDMSRVNGVNAPMAQVAARQDLRGQDRINEQQFNQEIWKSVKGAGSTMPAPRHAATRAAAAGPDSDG